MTMWWDRIDRSDDCWLWPGSHDRDGYALVTLTVEGGRVNRRVHRLTYEAAYGPVPAGLVLDHYVCNRTGCVNPSHLRPVTPRENTLRSDTRHTLVTPAMRCSRGHDLTVELGTRSDGWPKCKACHREWQRDYRARQRA